MQAVVVSAALAALVALTSAQTYPYGYDMYGYPYSTTPNFYPVSNNLQPTTQQQFPWMQPTYPQQQQQQPPYSQNPSLNQNNIIQQQSLEIEKELAILSGKPAPISLQQLPSQPPALSAPSGGITVPSYGTITPSTSGSRNRPVAVIPKHTSGAFKDEAPDTHEATKGASESHGHTHFGYRPGEGPETWPKHFPGCAGKGQSPIDINSNRLEPRRLPPLIREHLWAQPESMVVENNGHTLELDGDWRAGKYPTMRGGPLLDNYQFKQAHFHWGRNDNEGSEHTVNGGKMPMEVHMVHWNLKYGSYEKAVKNADGLAVLGAFFEVTKTNNSMFEVLFPYLDSVEGKDAVGVHMRDPTPIGILPVDLKNYVTYQGSLTTPPCSEVVTWIVATTPLTLSDVQMKHMRSIVKDDHGDIENFRPPQGLNGRKVYLNTN